MRSQISAPIEPPPPVTTIDLPCTKVSRRPVVDLDAGPQQQVFDLDRREPQRLAALVERRQPAGREPEPARPHQDRFGLRLRLERGRREHQAGHLDLAVGEIGDDALEIVESAQHRRRRGSTGRDRRATATGCRPARSW